MLRIDGENLRYVPLMERKAKLRALVSNRNDHVLNCDHVETHGEKLFALACKKDMEGIVAKRKYDPYIVGQVQWVKIRNTAYSQWEGAGETMRARAGSRSRHLYVGCVRGGG